MADATTLIDLTAVINAIWYDIDHRDGSAVSGHFTPEGRLRFDAREFQGTAAIDEVYARRAARGARVSRHGASNIHVVSEDAAGLDVVSLLFLYAADGEAPIPSTAPAAVSDVYDRFERVEERWLIASRAIMTRFIHPDTVLAVPTR